MSNLQTCGADVHVWPHDPPCNGDVCQCRKRVWFTEKPSPPLASASPQQDWIADVIQSVAELPDRSSPEDWPEAMLVTADELRGILTPLASASPSQEPTPRLLSADEAEHLALMGLTQDRTIGLAPGAAERIFAVAEELIKSRPAPAASLTPPQRINGLCVECGEAMPMHRAGCTAADAKYVSDLTPPQEPDIRINGIAEVVARNQPQDYVIQSRDVRYLLDKLAALRASAGAAPQEHWQVPELLAENVALRETVEAQRRELERR